MSYMHSGNFNFINTDDKNEDEPEDDNELFQNAEF